LYLGWKYDRYGCPFSVYYCSLSEISVALEHPTSLILKNLLTNPLPAPDRIE